MCLRKSKLMVELEKSGKLQFSSRRIAPSVCDLWGWSWRSHAELRRIGVNEVAS